MLGLRQFERVLSQSVTAEQARCVECPTSPVFMYRQILLLSSKDDVGK